MTTLCQGLPPLTARTEPWMERLLTDPDVCAGLLARYGSPVNLLDFTALSAHLTELVSAAKQAGIAMRPYVARKANKASALVTAAVAAGAGIDVASPEELRQSMDLGVPGSDIIVSAAVKDRELMDLALGCGATVSLDNLDEVALLTAAAHRRGLPAHVALRLAVTHPSVPPTRFGLSAAQWQEQARWFDSAINVEGVHFHLNGYSRDERAVALFEACLLVDELREQGHRVGYIDMGGGIPMSYLDDESQWRAFWRALEMDTDRKVTWHGDRLGMTDSGADRPSAELYPFWQREVRGAWLSALLTTEVGGSTPARLLTERGLELRCEPGRSVLDGCGVTLAEVAFRKETSDRVPLVGLRMNRTQLRSTSSDVLLDPRWVRPRSAGDPSPATEAFLVGAYCIEEEILLRRRISFPRGVAVGDVCVFINTAGYLMHILESTSHQLPLAQNLVHGHDGWLPDTPPGPSSTDRSPMSMSSSRRRR